MQRKLLIVDDDPNMIKLIKFYLSSENYEINSAKDGHKALEYLIQNKVDLVLADVQMPEMDGFTLVKKMKGELKIASPIIMVTAHGTADDIMSIIENGAFDILQKPFTSNRLKLTIKIALKYKILQEKYTHLKAHQRKLEI